MLNYFSFEHLLFSLQNPEPTFALIFLAILHTIIAAVTSGIF